MIFLNSMTLVLGWMAESAQSGNLLLTYLIPFLVLLFIIIIPICVISIDSAKPKHVASNRIPYDGKRSQYVAKRRQQYVTKSHNVSHDSKQKLVRSRLRKFDLPIEEAELVFGKRWKYKLGKNHIEPSGGLFFEILKVQNEILINLSYRKKILHIVDKLIRMVDSVFNEDHTTKWFDKQYGEGGYENYKNYWEFFKIYKKIPSETKSENKLTLAQAYKELELDSTATIERVEEKYHNLALKHHPDKGGKQEKFKRIMQAYEITRQHLQK